ncbi:hypothetical protein [Sulfurifustis variabilis]|uniref:hypothetical protein n=1 Tax=Sulfurifustis variabilis TaxID=1675686 RepID=UPI0014754C10|nr:hypothetical protein [Sulfurifustis variabilis]
MGLATATQESEEEIKEETGLMAGSLFTENQNAQVSQGNHCKAFRLAVGRSSIHQNRILERAYRLFFSQLAQLSLNPCQAPIFAD